MISMGKYYPLTDIPADWTASSRAEGDPEVSSDEEEDVLPAEMVGSSVWSCEDDPSPVPESNSFSNSSVGENAAGNGLCRLSEVISHSIIGSSSGGVNIDVKFGTCCEQASESPESSESVADADTVNDGTIFRKMNSTYNKISETWGKYCSLEAVV